MRGAMLESRLEKMGVLRSFSRPRVSNDNPYSESLFRTVKYRHSHSGIKFVTPHQRHSGAATVIASSELMFTRQPDRQNQRAGAEAPVAGVNPMKCGSTSQQRNQLRSWRYH